MQFMFDQFENGELDGFGCDVMDKLGELVDDGEFDGLDEDDYE